MATMMTTISVKFKNKDSIMKKYLFIALASLFAFASCSKESNETPEMNGDKTVNLTFTSKRPQLKSESKTAWDGTTIVWSETDKIRVGCTIDGEWLGAIHNSGTHAYELGNAKFYASSEISIDTENPSIGTFTIPIGNSSFVDPQISGVYQFYSFYPSNIYSSAGVSDPSALSITLPSSQTLSGNTYDSSSDLMVGQSSAITSSGLPTDPISLVWNRLVAHADLTFSNMAFVGTETVNKITLTFNEEAKVAGTVEVNIPAGTAGSGSTNVLVLSSNTGISSSSSSFEAWACVLPVTFTSLLVEIKTNKAIYTRTINNIRKTFKQNARNTLTINMSTATRIVQEEYDWVKKDLSAITSSDVFVIVGNSNGSNYAMSNNNGTNIAPSAVAVTVSNNKLAADPAESIQWTLTKSGSDYTFYPNGTNETWLYCTNTNNGVRVGTNATNNAFVWDNSGYLKNTSTSRYIGIYNSQDWRCYTSTGTNIENQTFAFYVRTGAAPSKPVPVITFSEPTTSVNIGESVTNVATIDPASLAISYSSSDNAIATVTSAGTVTGVAAGTATITASFAGDATYDEASTSYNITVVDPDASSPDNPYSASEAAALALGGSTASDVYVKGIISAIVDPYNSTYDNVTFDISDDGLTSSTQFRIYRASASSANDYQVGDVVLFKGTLTVYNSIAEFEQGSEKISQILAPRFSPDGGYFSTNTQLVALSADSDSQIRYTTNGIDPTATTGTVYSSSISISATTTIKAIAVKGGEVTGVVSRTFTKSSATLKYTLDGTDSSQGTNGYATGSEISQSNIDWIAVANTTTNPWRFGGKSLTKVDRALYSTKAISSNISSIEVESGTATVTVNSLTISVHNSDTDAASGDNPIATKTVTSGIISSTVTLSKTDATSWAGKYYRIVYNVTAGSSNQYVQFKSAKFYGN